MARRERDDEECPHCGLRYGELRTGLTFDEVKQMLWSPSEDSKDWRYRRRNTVLGAWHGFKQQLWARHLEGCELAAAEDSDVPF